MPSPAEPRIERPISHKADRLLRRLRNLTSLGAAIIGIASMVFSFAGLTGWVRDHGGGGFSIIIPIIIDGTMIVSTLYYTYISIDTGKRSWSALSIVLAGTIASVAGNVAHGYDGTWDSAVIYSLGPLGMLVGIEFSMALWRKQIAADIEAEDVARKAEEKLLKAEARRQAKIERQQAVEAPQERVEAPSAPRVQASAPKRSQGGSVKVDQARVEAVKAVMETDEYKALDARNGKFNPALASLLMNSVEGVTPLEARRAGVLLIDGMTPDAHRMQVARSFSNAEKKAKVEVASDADQEDAEPSVRRLAAV